jgi:hypothetical protein
MNTSTERAAFLASLEPKDLLIHELAVKMLKTRYTPERTNSWAAWKKSQQAAAAADARPAGAPAGSVRSPT